MINQFYVHKSIIKRGGVHYVHSTISSGHNSILQDADREQT